MARSVKNLLLEYQKRILTLVADYISAVKLTAPHNKIFINGGMQMNFENFIKEADCLVMTYNTLQKEVDMSYRTKEGALFQRKDKRWEARLYIDGKQKCVACCYKKEDAYNKLKAAIQEKEKSGKPERGQKVYTLHTWLDHWHEVFRKPLLNKELSKNTLISDVSFIKKAKEVFPNVKLTDLKAHMIQDTLNKMTLTRTCEGVYTILKLALEKAVDQTNGFCVMSLVKKVKHKRKLGRALSKDEIKKLLDAAANDMERDVIRFYIYTGCRVDEISATKVNYINLTDKPRIITGLTNALGEPTTDMELLPNEILIHGTKTKLSIRTMPILPPLKPILERLIKDRDGEERLFPYSTPMIRVFHKAIKEKSGVKFTLKDYRHTAATNLKDMGFDVKFYHSWFGWSDDSMSRKVYTHKTGFEKEKSQELASQFSYTI